VVKFCNECMHATLTIKQYRNLKKNLVRFDKFTGIIDGHIFMDHIVEVVIADVSGTKWNMLGLFCVHRSQYGWRNFYGSFSNQHNTLKTVFGGSSPSSFQHPSKWSVKLRQAELTFIPNCCYQEFEFLISAIELLISTIGIVDIKNYNYGDAALLISVIQFLDISNNDCWYQQIDFLISYMYAHSWYQ